ncbi:ABC transporter ATP-binding protein [Stieleria varia]|uniref:ABC transporter ATP-binding protein YtrB n=1 Tax=Stieleria varia TaxID=2528005 RepID=A0A5C6AZA6_9BACT|nr:ABC transporter ATP-binding protein [Stieleria varia]TWU04462.1 ABC transporter ATP-binding protein YtrB [Stieleria varia]
MSGEATSKGDPSQIVADVHRLSRAFRGKQALQDVTLQIRRGTIFGLVGLNGAGKTTLIKHLIGSLKAKHGSVTVLGQDPTVEPEKLLARIGYLSEEDSLPKWLRVGELIQFLRSIYPTWSDDYAKELCETFQLSHNDKLSSLSKGGRARVGLLAAIAHRPEFLILDEPSSGLDPLARRDILEAVIRTVSDDGRTVLFSSHLLDEVDRVCDTVTMIHQGRLIASMEMPDLTTRFTEIVCRPETAWVTPPSHAGVFGWNRQGNEWSAVVDLQSTNESALGATGLQLIQRREITLQRWFSARAQDGGDQHADSNNSSSKETADV